MIDRATVERILDAAQIVDVVSDFVTLRKAGVNYKGLFPFHDDRTPSFVVSPTKGLCKCFACGKGGNAVHFIMEHEQLSYPDALRYLAKKYNIETEVIYKGYPSPSVDINGEAFKMVESAINECFPGVGCSPYVVTGATDARFYSKICDSCVRFAPVIYGPEQMKGMHGLDENIECNTLQGAVDFYKKIITMQKR